jgi:predicted transposase/invertase (TIGR01784 family)
MPRYLNTQSDIVFKKIFGQYPDLLKSFLNAVLPLPEDGLIDSLEYLPFEQTPVIPTFKHTVVDVKCTDQKGRIFIVEMQIQWVDSFMQRMLFGASQAYVKQLEKGEEYELLNPVYGLGLLASTFDHESEDWYHHYKIINIQKPERELKGLQLVFVELPKFKPRHLAEKKLQVLWLRFLSEINEKTRVVEPELLQVPEINKALSLAEESAYTQAELAAYEKYWDSVSTEKTLVSGFYKQGLQEGLQQGLQQGAHEVLIRQLTRKFGAVPAHYQQRIQRASVEQLFIWSEQLLEAGNLEDVFRA